MSAPTNRLHQSGDLIATRELLEELDLIGQYEIGYGQSTCAIVRTAAQLIRDLGEVPEDGYIDGEAVNAEVTVC